jgi:hypothetical protein
MAFGTVSLIPEKIEPAFWLVIFVTCAYIIVKVCPGKYFLNGFFVSLINCVWLTIVHAFFFESYKLHHPGTAAMYSGPHPQLMMVAWAPAFGVMFGVILGLITLITSKIVKNKPV